MSDPVRERLASLRARLVLSSAAVSFHYHQEETVGDIGYFRVRCTLIDGSELQLYPLLILRRGGAGMVQ